MGPSGQTCPQAEEGHLVSRPVLHTTASWPSLTREIPSLSVHKCLWQDHMSVGGKAPAPEDSRRIHPRGCDPHWPYSSEGDSHLLIVFQFPPSPWWATALRNWPQLLSSCSHVFNSYELSFCSVMFLFMAYCSCCTQVKPPRAMSMALQPGRCVTTWADII